jgi:hypothetical protein
MQAAGNRDFPGDEKVRCNALNWRVFGGYGFTQTPQLPRTRPEKCDAWHKLCLI